MATERKNRNKNVGLCVMVVTGCLVLAIWAVLAAPQIALAKKPPKPDPVLLGDARFLTDGGLDSEIDMSPLDAFATEVAESTYRTRFGTGRVVVTLLDVDGTVHVLDQKPSLIRFDDDSTGDHLVFRIGLQGGHKIQDRFSTPTPSEGIGEPDLAIDFPGPDKVWNSGAGESDPGVPSLEVKTGSVDDENLDMLPGAHVVLHLHVSDVPLINMTGPNAGHVIGTISIGDIEFIFPE